MPELPEVETIRLELEKSLVNQRIQKIRCLRRDLRLPIPDDLACQFEGQRILGLRRRAKYLWIDCWHERTLIVHLGMSGRLYLTHATRPLHPHDHVLFHLSQTLELRFRDPRRFGLILHHPTAQLHTHPLFIHLGPEPLSTDFNTRMFYPLCQHSTAPIKNLLMNAHKIVGVGNIYANEALFVAGIRPDQPAKNLTRRQIDKLVQAIKKVLQKSITMGGTTLRDYVSANEEPGLHQNHLLVYNRQDQACKKCNQPINKKIMAGRSSFYCKKCQK